MFLTPSTHFAVRALRSLANEAALDTLSRIPVNSEYNDKEYVYNLMLPGFTKEEVKVSLEDNRIRIDAEKKIEEKVEGSNPNQVISRMWETSTQKVFLNVPTLADMDKADVKLENGVLSIVIPRKGAETKLLEIK